METKSAVRRALERWIANHGPIATVRVSSSGMRHRRQTWGAARYCVRLTHKGELTHSSLERARGNYTTKDAAIARAELIASSEGRLFVRWLEIGYLCESDCRTLIYKLTGIHTDGLSDVALELALLPYTEPVNA